MKQEKRQKGRADIRPVLCALCILMGLLFSACKETGAQEEPADGVYQIYYLNSNRTKLAAASYKTQTDDPDLLLGELAQQILKAPDYPDYQAILGDRTALLGIQKEDNILYLNFNREYSAAKPSREILCRAALAKTFTQIPGIDYISINCDGQPLWDSHGNPVGAFSGSDFVESVSDVNSFERVELKLYFANEAGDSLVPETRELVHNISTSMEKLVVEQLLAGPQGGAGAVLPKDTKILNVSLTDGVCYVNLDGSFLNGNPDMAEYIPVYALVNSLTELQTVTRVQITVAGSADVMYRNAISLASPLGREEKYIQD